MAEAIIKMPNEFIEVNGVKAYAVPGWPEYYVTTDGRVFSLKLSGGRWLSAGKKSGYSSFCLHKNAVRKNYPVHRIMAMTFFEDWQEGESVVDHVDGVRSNNDISNIRLVDYCENAWNSRSRKSNNSGFIGAHFDNAKGKWIASIGNRGTRKTIGRFKTAIEAAVAYDIAAIQNRGGFAVTNFDKNLYGSVI